ncbi:flagellar filament capping protein FliD [Roseateles violae]|uniref:Flagellar hook-associated protein 2 n=1 Tax=Roseateles violae TaxID=3058042 RepID=A0ABT8DP46_9BURK|nr:flagellar filament capping protein FliD [Pelomonas sp. PFR6]MDN3919778.1 flagellar filament capping protein FliD [Pelomonas sp. PFR6]
MGISSIGIGSGLDANSIISKLVELEKKPLTTLQTSATFIQTQISSYGKVQSLLSGVTTAATALSKATLWTQSTVGSTNTAITGSASAGATPGSYSVQVTQLATAQSLATNAFNGGSTSELGAGKLKIEFGSWSAGATSSDPLSFSEKSGGTPLELTFDKDTTTLKDVRDAINNAKAGVTASIVTDASGARLTIRSDKTGEENALRISSTDLDGNALTDGLAALNYQPDIDAAAGMKQTIAAANAKAQVNGLDVVSTTNTFTGAIENVSFTVSATTASPGTLNVANDSSSQRKAVQDFATAYNALNSYLVDQTKYDETNKIGGTLQGDSTVLTLRSQLRNVLRDTGAGNFSFLSLTSKSADAPRDGSLTLDTSALDKALADPAKMARLFSGDSSLSGTKGMAKKLADFTAALTGAGGSLSSRTEGLNNKLKLNQKEQDKVTDRVARTQERLEKQYQALDARMASLNALSTYVSQQVTQWNNSGSN